MSIHEPAVAAPVVQNPPISCFVDQDLVYGEVVELNHNGCRNQVLLIEIDFGCKIKQSGIIISSGPAFCYILTISILDIHKAISISITFGDGTEKKFRVSELLLRHGHNLSIIFVDKGVTTVQKDSAHFNEHEALKDTVVFTLGMIPTVGYPDHAVSCITGGNVSLTDLKYKHMSVFVHNCSLGGVAEPGSAVLDGNFEVVGINLKASNGSTMALSLEEIKYQIDGLFDGLERKMTFAEINSLLEYRTQRASRARSKRARIRP